MFFNIISLFYLLLEKMLVDYAEPLYGHHSKQPKGSHFNIVSNVGPKKYVGLLIDRVKPVFHFFPNIYAL